MAATVSTMPSAWGKPKIGDQEVEMGGGDAVVGAAESCLICRAEVPASVFFRPCGHKMCMACVEQTRVRNIYKADKGVKCPFCRQYVEEFVPLVREAHGREVLLHANAAAAKAAAARAPEQGASQCGDRALAQRRWKCLHCNYGQNSGITEMCNQCGRLKPELVVPQPPKGKDLLKYSVDEIIAACKAKWHPNLNKAFLEAGVPISIGKVQGDEESIVTALRKNGQKKLVMIVSTVAGSRRVYDLCQNMFGNYTVQDLLDATAKLREVAREGSKHDLLQSTIDELVGPNCSFELLFESLLEDLCDMSVHPTCHYVVQRLISLCTLDELCTVASSLLPKCIEIATDDKGCHVIHGLLEALNKLQDAVGDCSSNGNAQVAVNGIAGALYGDFRMMSWMASHSAVAGKIFLHALLGALPQYNALQVGSFLASYAHDIAQTKTGMRMVLGILSLHGSHIREVMRDFVCCIALSLQGNMAAYAACEPIDSHQLVGLLLQRLVDEGEVAWVGVIVEELVVHGEDLLRNPIGREVLSFALSLSAIQHQTAEVLIKKLTSQGLDTHELQDVVLHNRSEHIQDVKQAKPHWRPSIISPWLRFHIESGNEILPPPVPPAPKEQSFPELPQAQPSPPGDGRLPSPAMMYPLSTCGLKGSIWTEHSNYPPGMQLPPPPRPYSALPTVMENGYNLDPAPASAKLPADLMESLNSGHTESGGEGDQRCGVVEFGGIPVPPPAMYQYPGNWNFPDLGDTEHNAADLDVTEVINQFQDTSLVENHTNDQETSIYQPTGSSGEHMRENAADMGRASGEEEGLPGPLQRLFAPINQAGEDSASLMSKNFMGGEGADNSRVLQAPILDQYGVNEKNIGVGGVETGEGATNRSRREEVQQMHFAWKCHLCTYEHKGPQAEFLTCGMCGSTRGQSFYAAAERS